ncbi:MAG: response regulator [Acidobacteria bacterium]|jgi:CheY-like chemotaxis protein|nr:response regulator [Acidobacteriota bacterium]
MRPLTRILVVEDHTSFSRNYVEALEETGHAVLAVRGPEQAIAVANETRPDLIVLDTASAESTAVQVLGALKSHTETSAIPVIVISNVPEKNALPLLDSGVAAYRNKAGLTAEVFTETVRRALKKPAPGLFPGHRAHA